MNPDLALTTKNSSKRVDFIEIARVLAIFTIIFVHCHPKECASVYSFQFLQANVPFFFVTAGYFSRKITWKGIGQRMLVILIPLLIWASIYDLIFYQIVGSQPFTLSGCFLNLVKVFSAEHGNYTLWFLRDLAIYTALLPFLAMFRQYAAYIAATLFFVACCHFSFIPSWCSYYESCDIGGLSFFVLGFALQQIKIDDIKACINRYFKSILFIGLILNALIIFESYQIKGFEIVPFVQLLGVLCILSTAVAIEKFLPRLAKICLYIAPSCYLIYLSHYAIYRFVYTILVIRMGEQTFNAYSHIINWVIAIFIMVLAGVSFNLMRRYTPFLLPYIAGVKK